MEDIYNNFQVFEDEVEEVVVQSEPQNFDSEEAVIESEGDEILESDSQDEDWQENGENDDCFCASSSSAR